VQQCPAFEGNAAGSNDPFTGYNYNTSYIGGEEEFATRRLIPPVKLTQVRRPSETVVFGDAEFSGGSNRFMRSPFYSPTEIPVARYAGTQAFRHRGQSNAAYADGHAAPLPRRFTTTYSAEQSLIAPHTGFLAADNSIYDLD
jgi:prepilin-type processing-associated H-X9-DG protein